MSEPKNPGYSIKEVMKYRRKVKDFVVGEHLNCIAEGDAFEQLVADFAWELPDSVSRTALFESLRYLAGDVLTENKIDEAAWRLAGNLQKLRDSKPVYPWSVQREQEWVPGQVIRMRRTKTSKGLKAYFVTFQTLAGSCCPMKVVVTWTDKFCWYVGTTAGFSKKIPKFESGQLPKLRMRHPTELVSLRFNLLIDPELSASEPTFSKVAVPGSLKDWNQEKMKQRDRLEDGYTCPAKLPVTYHCFKCPVGYEKCKAATHKSDWVFAYCPECGSDKAAYDDEISNEMCINCFNQNALKG